MTGQREQALERALDRVSDGYVSVDSEWRIDWVNSRAEEMLDRTRDDLVGRPVAEALPGLAETELFDRLHRVAETGEAAELRVEYEPSGGWFEVRAHPSGTDGGLSVYFRDVTEPRRLDRELARTATIVEAVNDGVVTFDGDGTVTSVNQAAEQLLGADRRALVGSSVEELAAATALTADSTAELDAAIDAVRDGAVSERRFRVSCERDDDRRVGDVQLVALPVDDADGTVGVIRDVTERREHERIVTALHDVTRQLFAADSSEEICAIAVEAAADLLDLGLSGAWLLDEERNRLDPVAATAMTHDRVGGLPHFAENEGLIWDAFRSGESALYDDVREASGVYNPDTPIRSEMILPIGSHGVLMTGEMEPGQFDETDRELAEILAANVEAALDRTGRERLLRQRSEELERQRDRLETVASVLSRDIEQRLEAAREALPDSDGRDGTGTPNDALATAERLVTDVREVAGAASGERTRSRVSLAECATDAADRVDGAAVRCLDDATLRVERDRFVRFLATFFRFAAVRSDDTAVAHVGVLEGQSGFYVADDGSPLSGDERARVFDPEYAASLEIPGLGPALADEIATANGWDLSLSTASRAEEAGESEDAQSWILANEDGERPERAERQLDDDDDIESEARETDSRGVQFEISGVTTLSR